MERIYQLSCESTVDLPFSYVDGRGIKVLFYSYAVEGEEYPDDMGRDPEALNRFYGFIERGHIPSTSQLNEFAYEDFFRENLKEGKSLLHICLGTGMTVSYFNALKAAETVKKEFPEQDIIVIDSLCSSGGYGLLVDEIKDLMDEGKGIDEVVAWIEANRNHLHHEFYSTDLKYFRRTGRMSGPVAGVATILKICPIMHLNAKGKIIAYSKVMGKIAAIRRVVDTMEAHCEGGKDYSGKIFIYHSNSLNEALMTKEKLMERFPKMKGEPRILDIGTIIASHCGPGTVAISFLGDERGE